MNGRANYPLQPVTLGRSGAWTHGWAHVRSGALWLDEPSMQDLQDLHDIYGDERSWRHRPHRVHVEPQQTARMIQRSRDRFSSTGLAYWSIREQPGGKVIGWGGCAIPRGRPWWNLTYRIHPDYWGRGYAAQVAHRAMEAAQTLRPTLPILAYTDMENAASIAVLNKLKLRRVLDGSSRSDAREYLVVYLDRDPMPDYLKEISRLLLA